MGPRRTVAVRPGGCVAIPTGAVLPEGADAVVMVEYTAETMPGTIEVTRPVAPGAGLVGADEDVRRRSVCWSPAVGRCVPPSSGLLAAAGVTPVEVHARPRVAIISTGDEVVPPVTPKLSAGQVRDATASALAGLVTEAGGIPVLAGIVPDEPGRPESHPAATLVRDADLVVVSAGSSVGARDETAGAVPPSARSGATAWPSSRASRHCWPSAAGVPLIGLPGNPLSALVVFRLVGVPLAVAAGRCARSPPEPSAQARLARDVASMAGRLDVVQVARPRRDGRAAVRAVGVVVGADQGRRLHRRARAGHRARRRQRGRGHPVPMTPVTRAGWPRRDRRQPVHLRRTGRRRPCRLAGRLRARRMPGPGAAVRVPVDAGRRPGHGRGGLGAAVLAGLRLRRDGRHRRAGGRHGRGRPKPNRYSSSRRSSRWSTPAIRMPVGYDAVVMREHVHLTPTGQAELRAAVPPTSTSARSARTSAPTSCCCPKATVSARSTSRPRPPPAPSSCWSAVRPGW